MEVVLLAAGLGKRMQIDKPKQFFTINGKPILAYSLEVFNSLSQLSKIILVCQPNHIEDYNKIIRDYNIKNVQIVLGGETRQQSVYNGLQKVTSDKVIVHEAARPLISKEFVIELVEAASKGTHAIVPVLPVNFTVAIGEEQMEGILDRSKLRNIQLPQVFDTNIIKEAHEKAKKEAFQATEDSMLVFKYGGKVKFVRGRESNVKITTLYDVKMISNFLSFGYE
jgi:2-C-methyl-D-erythritol 4-phosphate cytidylyltransferase